MSLAELQTARGNSGDYNTILHLKDSGHLGDYQTKKDHDLLLIVIERQEAMREDVKDVKGELVEVKKAIALIQCPGVQCAAENARTCKLETTAEWQWIAIGAGFAFSALILSLLWGHVTTVSNLLSVLFTSWGLQ